MDQITSLSMFPPPPPPPNRQRQLSTQDWEDQRPRFQQLYSTEDRPLDEVMEVMEKDYGFRATKRQYKRKISQWHLDKNVKDAEMQFIIQKGKKRKAVEDKDTVFRVRGRLVESEKIARTMKRKNIPPDMFPSQPSPAAATPEDISYYTPAGEGPPTPNVSHITQPYGQSPATTPYSPVSAQHTSTPMNLPADQSPTSPASPASYHLFHPNFNPFAAQSPSSLPTPLAYSGPASSPVPTFTDQNVAALLPDLPGNIQPQTPGQVLDMSGGIAQELYDPETLFTFASYKHTMTETGAPECSPRAALMIRCSGLTRRSSSSVANQPRLPINESCSVPNQPTPSPGSQVDWDHSNAPETSEDPAATYNIKSQSEDLELRRRILKSKGTTLGFNHPDTLSSASDLALALEQNFRIKAAEEMYQRVLTGRKKVLGKEHPDTLAGMYSLGQTLYKLGRYREAEELLRGALAGMGKALGKEHPDTLSSVHFLGRTLGGQGRYGEAEELLRRALAVGEKVLGKEHPNVLASTNYLGRALIGQGRYREAEELLWKALVGGEKMLGKEHPDVLDAVHSLGQTLICQGRYGEAEELLRRALAGGEKVLGKEQPNVLASMRSLGQTLNFQGRYGEAEELLQRALAGGRRCWERNTPMCWQACILLVRHWIFKAGMERQRNYSEEHW